MIVLDYKKSAAYQRGFRQQAEIKAAGKTNAGVAEAMCNACAYLEATAGLPAESKAWTISDIEYARISIEKSLGCMNFGRGITEGVKA